MNNKSSAHALSNGATALTEALHRLNEKCDGPTPPAQIRGAIAGLGMTMRCMDASTASERVLREHVVDAPLRRDSRDNTLVGVGYAGAVIVGAGAGAGIGFAVCGPPGAIGGGIIGGVAGCFGAAALLVHGHRSTRLRNSYFLLQARIFGPGSTLTKHEREQLAPQFATLQDNLAKASRFMQRFLNLLLDKVQAWEGPLKAIEVSETATQREKAVALAERCKYTDVRNVAQQASASAVACKVRNGSEPTHGCLCH